MVELVTKYKRYAEYKDSGVEWLGEIPKDWGISRVKNQFNVFNGSTPKSGETEYWEGDIVWVTPSDLSQLDNYIISESSRNITIKGLNSCGTSLVPKSSLILSCRAPIGSLAVTGVELCTNQGCKSLVSISNVPIEFYYYYFSTINSVLNNLGRGSTFLELSTEDLTNLALPLPSIIESSIIVDFLNHETAQIDTLIEKQQTLISLLKEKRQAVISHAVTKGLNPDATMKDSGVEWLGEVPEHWEVTRIKYITSIFEQGWSPQCDSRPAESNEYGVLKVGCVNYGGFRPIENKALPPELQPRLQYLIEKNDLLISRANTKELVGSAAVVCQDYDNLLLCDKLYRLRFNSNIYPELIALYLSIEPVRKQIELQASGASHSMQNISQDVIKELPCFLLPNEEADELLKSINEKMKVFDNLVGKAESAIQLMQERRTALISAAVTGKIDVRGWVAPEVKV